MESLIQLAILGIGLLSIVVSFIWGSLNEKKHYESILAREDQFLDLPTLTLSAKSIGQQIDLNAFSESKLVEASVVIASDTFKRLKADLLSFFGGNISDYESLIDRARREAILRLKEKAGNADLIINMQLSTVELNSGGRKNKENKTVTVCVLAYATALYK
jgi:uncharacterized protein YbjQ (UPF0145 family)